MLVGLDALMIFKAKGTVKMRKKYPSIYYKDIDKSISLKVLRRCSRIFIQMPTWTVVTVRISVLKRSC